MNSYMYRTNNVFFTTKCIVVIDDEQLFDLSILLLFIYI